MQHVLYVLNNMQPCESLREAYWRINKCKIHCGEPVTALWEVIDVLRSNVYYKQYRSNDKFVDGSVDLPLTPQTTVTVKYVIRPTRRNTYFYVNGRRVSRDHAMSAARQSWEGGYPFER